jgi:ABC-2 type transport system ATP-binding protein
LEAAAGIEPASRVLQTLAWATRLRRLVRRPWTIDELGRLLLHHSGTRADLSRVETAVVVLDDVQRMFGDVVALDSLSMQVPAGSVTVLVGPNGAGKTTVVRLVTGALGVQAGRVRVFGLDPSGPEGAEVRGRCGVVPARPALYDRLTGYDNLRYCAELFDVRSALIETRIRDAAERFGILDALPVRVGAYSTGMRARLALARAILHDPGLLLLDEPTAGLDPESARAVLGLIDELAAQGRAVLMCTHLLLEAEGLADEVVVLNRGRTLVSGSPAELTRRYWPACRVVSTRRTRRCSTAHGPFRSLTAIDATGARRSILARRTSFPIWSTRWWAPERA